MNHADRCPGTVLYWALHVALHVAGEDRIKQEVVLARPDLAVVPLYHWPPAAALDEAQLVLVREVRAVATTVDGYVHELPGGAIMDGADRLQQAVAEVREETGLSITPSRLREHGRRQLLGPMSAHHAHLYSAQLTATELEQLKAARAGHGDRAESEQTVVEVVTFDQLRDHPVDWATLGMITQVVTDLRQSSSRADPP